MTTSGLEVIPMSEAVRWLDISCDYADDGRHQHGPAEWVMWLEPCCADAPKARLACDICKTERLTVQLSAVQCEACGHVTAPARKAYRMTEAL